MCFSKFAFVFITGLTHLFCKKIYNKSLNDWSRGELCFLFPKIKIHCSPRDQSLSVKGFIMGHVAALVRSLVIGLQPFR